MDAHVIRKPHPVVNVASRFVIVADDHPAA